MSVNALFTLTGTRWVIRKDKENKCEHIIVRNFEEQHAVICVSFKDLGTGAYKVRERERVRNFVWKFTNSVFSFFIKWLGPRVLADWDYLE